MSRDHPLVIGETEVSTSPGLLVQQPHNPKQQSFSSHKHPETLDAKLRAHMNKHQIVTLIVPLQTISERIT